MFKQSFDKDGANIKVEDFIKKRLKCYMKGGWIPGIYVFLHSYKQFERNLVIIVKKYVVKAYTLSYTGRIRFKKKVSNDDVFLCATANHFVYNFFSKFDVLCIIFA